MEYITIPINEDYKPLLAIIDEIALECKTSRAGIIRTVLCDTFEFSPRKPIIGQNSLKNKKLDVKRDLSDSQVV